MRESIEEEKSARIGHRRFVNDFLGKSKAPLGIIEEGDYQNDEILLQDLEKYSEKSLEEMKKEEYEELCEKAQTDIKRLKGYVAVLWEVEEEIALDIQREKEKSYTDEDYGLPKGSEHKHWSTKTEFG